MSWGRLRSRSTAGEEGFIIHLPSGTSTSRVSGGSLDQCTDIVGDKSTPHPLDITRTSLRPGLVSGRPPAFPVYAFENYAYDNQPVASHAVGWGDGMLDLTESVTRVASRTSPMAPTASLPVFIAELKDIPRMLHLKGIQHIRKYGRLPKRSVHPGSIYLEWHFGWEQLYKDVWAIFQFQKDVEGRVRSLTEAYSKGALRRAGTVWSNVVTSEESDVDFQTFNAQVRGRRTTVTEAKRWASVVWRPTNPPPTMANADVLSQARRSVHGWRLSPADVWEVIPWSWLVDYFVNVQEVLETYSGGAEFSVSEGCVMTHIRTTVVDTIEYVSDGFTATGSVAVLEQKLRALATPGLTLRSGFLSSTKLTNLAALAVNLFS